MTAPDLLAAADALLTGGAPRLLGCWQRVCAALIRTALETTLEGFWQQRAPGVVGTTMRTQLLILPLVAGAAAGVTARRAWNGLSWAVHHHSYELPPNAAELRSWYDDVTELSAQLARSAEAHGER